MISSNKLFRRYKEPPQNDQHGRKRNACGKSRPKAEPKPIEKGKWHEKSKPKWHKDQRFTGDLSDEIKILFSPPNKNKCAYTYQWQAQNKRAHSWQFRRDLNRNCNDQARNQCSGNKASHCFLSEILVCKIPVNEIPPGLNVFRTCVAIVDIIGVFPHIAGKNRRVAFS